MGFSWLPITPTQTKLDDTHINQVKTNVDTLTSNLGIPAYSWTVLPVTGGVSKVTAAQVTQLQAAINYVDTQNYCATHYASYNSGVDATHNISRDVTHNTLADSPHNATYQNGYDVTIYSTRLTTQDGSHYPGYYSAYYPSHQNGYDSSVCSSYYPSNLVPYNASVRWVDCDKQGGCKAVYSSHIG